MEMLSSENMRSIVNGQAQIPAAGNGGLITIRSSELQGSFKTPGFGDPTYQGNFYDGRKTLHYVLNLPDNKLDLVGEGALVISVETQGNWSYMVSENGYQMHRE